MKSYLIRIWSGAAIVLFLVSCSSPTAPRLPSPGDNEEPPNQRPAMIVPADGLPSGSASFTFA